MALFPPQNPTAPVGPGWPQRARTGTPPQGFPSAAPAGYQIQDATPEESVDFSPGGFQYGIAFDPTGSQLFILDAEVENVWQVNLPTAFDLTGGTLGDNFPMSGVSPRGLAFGASGTLMYALDDFPADQILLAELDVGYDLTSVVAGENLAIQGPRGIAFNDDGTTAIFPVPGGINSLPLGTPYDLRTLQMPVTENQDVPPELTDIVFIEEGTRAFALDFDCLVYEYSLGTAFDILTLDLQQSVDFSDSVPGGEAVGLAFSNDGTKMFIQSAGGPVVEYVGL